MSNPLMMARFLLAIALLVLYNPLYSCSPQNSRVRIKNQPETANLVRVKLVKSNELDSFEAISRSHKFNHYKDDDKLTKPFALSSQLVGLVGVGQPAQEFRFIFDTSSRNMRIPSLNCTECGDRKRYNSSASTTYIKNGTPIQIGRDLGFLSIDKVSFGDVIIENQTFAEMSSDEDFDEDSNYYDGHFCLGYDLFAKESIATPMRQMLNQKLIDHEVFAIYQNSTGGEIVFGGFEDKHIVPWINWLPSEDVAYWSFRMESLTLKRSTISREGPLEEVTMINEAMGAQPDQEDESIFVLPDCELSKLPNLVLRIESDEFELSPERYVQKVRKGDKIICTSSLHAVPSEYSKLWSIGSSIVGHIYTVFDYEDRAIVELAVDNGNDIEAIQFSGNLTILEYLSSEDPRNMMICRKPTSN